VGAFTAIAIATIASAGVSAIASAKAGKSAERAGVLTQDAANDAAALQDWNAQVADLQAEDAIARGADDESRLRGQVRGIIGAQRAAGAANKVDVGFGSTLDVQADAAFLGELDALQVRSNAQREAWGYKVDAENLRRQANITRKEGVAAAASGRQQKTQAYLGAANTVLGAGTSLIKAKYGFS